MGQFLPDDIYPMAGMRTKRFVRALCLIHLAMIAFVVLGFVIFEYL